MTELKKLQQDYSDNRKQIAGLDADLQKAKAELSNLNSTKKKVLKGLDGKARESSKSSYDKKEKDLSALIEKISSDRKSLVEQLGNLSVVNASQLNPVEKIVELNDAFPILMFPLRLEIRFKTIGSKQQLWLRVYPDDCVINRKEELLTQSELKNVKLFWIEIWKAGGIESEERGAWKSLVNSHGSGRSAWIIEQYKPTNTKPTKPDPKNKILVVISQLTLSDSEHLKARNYWAAVWLSKGNKELLDEALNALKSSVGEVRAAEIIEKYVPENIRDVVPTEVENQSVLLEKLELPSQDEYTTTQTSWTRAPKAIALPDWFVAVAYTGNSKRTILFDKHVKENLPVGPDPMQSADEQIIKDENGDLVINEDLKWMVDFENAIQAGMGVKIDLTTVEAVNGFDKLFVLGFRFSSDESESKTQLEKLFTDHFQGKDGFGLLKQGTPTNNTEDEPAGYSWIDEADESFERIFKQTENFEEKNDTPGISDGQKLADSLGIDPEVLKKVPHANGRDQLEANAANKALFPATLGYFMEEMMNPLFSDDDLNDTNAFFSDFVSAMGPIPAIRIGKQPYGILPVSVYSRMKFYDNRNIAMRAALGDTKYPYLTRLHSLLMKMDATWDELLPKVAYIGKDGDPHQILLDVIGLNANSIEFHQRYSQSIQQLYNQLVLQTGPKFAGQIAAAVADRGNAILKELNIDIKDAKLPILEKYFLSDPSLLSGPLVDDVPPSEINPIRPYSSDGKNYIDWLISSDAEEIRIQNFGGNPAPAALLYLLLRHALMLAQADAATQLLVTHKVVENKKVFFDPEFINVQKNESGKSKFEHLYNAYPTITGSNELKLVDFLYTANVLKESAETKRLRDTIDALKVLDKTPTARLERLLAEHLDCCNYRIDAWKTGLAGYKLAEQRLINQLDKKPSKGLYLGAYGWLIDVKPGKSVLTDVNLSEELNKIFNKGNNKPIQTDSKNLGYIHAPSLNQAATAAILRNTYDSNRNSGSGNPFAINLTSDRVRIADSFLEGMRNGQSLSALLGYQFERGLHDKHSLGQGEVDKFIYPLRKAFPLVADNLIDTKSDTSDSIESIEANNVIDGLKFINHIQNSSIKTYPFDLPAEYDLPSASISEAKAIGDELKRIMEINDAISDLVIAEQVYQVVRGNFEKASGVAEAFSKGKYPPDMDIMNTPRSGVTLTQRMAIQLDADADSNESPYKDSDGNDIIEMTPRGKAEPSVNKWLSSIFPDPVTVLCKVVYNSPTQTDKEIDVSQVDLGLQPIDFLYCFNLDSEQAMSELDDRISNYVRYKISKHPKTDIKINYTKQIDKNDKTKISFFELAALVKSLRKILIGSKYLNSADVTLPEVGEQQTHMLDDVQLAIRVTAARDSLILSKSSIGSIITSTKSIAGSADIFKTDLTNDIPDVSKVNDIINRLKSDLKEYLTDSSATNKNGILSSFETSILSIGDAVKIAVLKNKYETLLDAYLADFPNFDALAENTINSFLSAARFENTQTGTGFIYQGISGVYDSIFLKLDKVRERWDKKNADFTDIINSYNASAVEAEKFVLLQKAEGVISSQRTFPLNVTLNDYKIIIDGKKASFDISLNNLKLLKTNAKEKVIEFIVDTESLLNSINNYDLISFDTKNNRNDLLEEKLMIASLKEDIKAALDNLNNSVTERINSAEEFITASGITSVNSEKIKALLNCANQVFGAETLILPHFKLSDVQAGEFENSFNTSEGLLNFVKTNESRIFPVEDWLGGVSRVREKVFHWENVSFLSNGFKPDSAMELMPLQFPYKEDDRWAAMKFKDETDSNDKFQISNDKLLYTGHFAIPFDKSKSQCGIVVDEWTEVIPSNEETTGITFNYNQPNSEPPQTMLLVIPPEFTGNWKWDDVIESMEETLQMAKKRAVEPSQIETTNYAQFLPTTMMAVTLYWITVATNLATNNNIYQKMGK